MGTTDQATRGKPASGKIDPASIPQRQFNTGAAIPAIGLGRFGSDSIPAAEVAEAVRGAAEIGYRHWDCASL